MVVSFSDRLTDTEAHLGLWSLIKFRGGCTLLFIGGRARMQGVTAHSRASPLKLTEVATLTNRTAHLYFYRESGHKATDGSVILKAYPEAGEMRLGWLVKKCSHICDISQIPQTGSAPAPPHRL